jgi:hypothetical protein
LLKLLLKRRNALDEQSLAELNRHYLQRMLLLDRSAVSVVAAAFTSVISLLVEASPLTGEN